MYEGFNVLLKSIDLCFIKDSYIYDYQGYRSVVLFFSISLSLVSGNTDLTEWVLE